MGAGAASVHGTCLGCEAVIRSLVSTVKAVYDLEDEHDTTYTTGCCQQQPCRRVLTQAI
jgi:hypothetical protein